MSSDPFDGAATDSLRIHAFASLNPGPRLLVLGGVHGDEISGTLGIERILAELEAGTLRLQRGELTLVPVANPLARRRLQREGERNLNRLFRPTEAPADYEARVTNALAPLIARHEVLLDLHSFQSEGEAFAMIGPRDNTGTLEPFARSFEEGQLALHIGTPIVLKAGSTSTPRASRSARAARRPTKPPSISAGAPTNTSAAAAATASRSNAASTWTRRRPRWLGAPFAARSRCWAWPRCRRGCPPARRSHPGCCGWPA